MVAIIGQVNSPHCLYTVFPCFGGRGCIVVWFVAEAIIVMPIIRYSIFSSFSRKYHVGFSWCYQYRLFQIRHHSIIG